MQFYTLLYGRVSAFSCYNLSTEYVRKFNRNRSQNRWRISRKTTDDARILSFDDECADCRLQPEIEPRAGYVPQRGNGYAGFGDFARPKYRLCFLRKHFARAEIQTYAAAGLRT